MTLSVNRSLSGCSGRGGTHIPELRRPAPVRRTARAYPGRSSYRLSIETRPSRQRSYHLHRALSAFCVCFRPGAHDPPPFRLTTFIPVEAGPGRKRCVTPCSRSVNDERDGSVALLALVPRAPLSAPSIEVATIAPEGCTRSATSLRRRKTIPEPSSSGRTSIDAMSRPPGIGSSHEFLTMLFGHARGDVRVHFRP